MLIDVLDRQVCVCVCDENISAAEKTYLPLLALELEFGFLDDFVIVHHLDDYTVAKR